MKVIKEPNWNVTCNRCKAELEFTFSDVEDGRTYSGKRGNQTFKKITCPYCKSTIRVWEN